MQLYVDIYPQIKEIEKLRDKIRLTCLSTINDLSLNAFDRNCLQWELQFMCVKSQTSKYLFIYL